MKSKRLFKVVVVGAEGGRGAEQDGKATDVVYDGHAVTVAKCGARVTAASEKNGP
jgi:hypothetical protein